MPLGLQNIGEPNLSQLAEAIIDGAAEDVRVAMPGVVTSVNMRSSTVSVQPAVKRNGADNYDPIIPDVPLCFPRSSTARLTFPVNAGDNVLLVFSDRSIEDWLRAGGSKASAGDARIHDITDAFAIPMSIESIPLDRLSDLSLEHEGGEVRIDSTGNTVVDGVITVKLGGSATQPIMKGTIFNTAHGIMLTAISTAFNSLANDPALATQTKTDCGLAVTAIAAFTAAIATWLSAKALTE